jgi:glucose dehydrogenase
MMRQVALSRTMRIISIIALLGTLAGSALAQRPGERQGPVTPTALGPAIPPELIRYATDWPAAQGNLAGTRAAVSSIQASNVTELEVAWRFPVTAVTGYGGMTATPLIAGETVYLQDMRSNVFALDRTTGAVRWQREFDVPTIGPNGLALGYGMIFGAIGDTAEAFALDAATGALIWRVRLSNNPFEGIDMAPAVYNNTVYISTVAGNTHGFNRGGTRGILFALDAASGATLWQFDTTTDNLWGNPRINSGGGLWYPPSFDAEGNLYFGVANAGPWPGTAAYPNGSSRPGANDYASSLVSLSGETGALRWHINAAPHDLFDHDFQNTPVLTTVEVEGRHVPVAIGSGKTGTVFAANQKSGEILWQTAVGVHHNDHLRELPGEPGEWVAPGAWGGVISPVAVADDRVYVPVVNLPTRYASTGVDRESMFDFAQGRGQLIALDASTGTVLWQQDLPTPALAGATVAGDLVFTAGMDGILRAFEVSTGREIWSYRARAGINAPIAIAGDTLIVAAAGPWLPPERDSDDPAPQTMNEVIAFRLPAEQATALPAKE